MKRYEYYMILQEKYTDINVFSEIERTCRKIEEHFETHNNILVSVSGGSDSDCIVHLICTYFPEYVEKCRFVFVNTGLEYEATKRHLCDLEKRYGITIDRIRGQSVVSVVRKYGIPILSKYKSAMARNYIVGMPHAWGYIFGDKVHTMHSMIFTDNQKKLVQYLADNQIKVSAQCCTYSKKKPLKHFQKEHEIDLSVTGERKAEGGQRALAHSSCFQEYKNDIPRYMPLWWWSNETKRIFKETEGVRYSDCYEVYGMKRTGCCGCPFNLNIADELQAMYEYEPGLFKACMNVFGQAYELTDRFNCRRKKCLPESFQMRFENA